MYRKILLFIVFALLGLLIQATFVHALYPSAIAPDFIVILVVSLALRRRSPFGMLGAFALGMLADFTSAQFVGPFAGGAVVSYCLAGIIADRIFVERGLGTMFIGFCCSIAKSGTFLLVLFVSVEASVSIEKVFSVVLIEALLTGLFTPFVLALLQWFSRGETQISSAPNKSLRFSHEHRT